MVDDSSYNLFVLRELIESIDSKLELESAMNGREAIDQVVSYSEDNKTFDFILMDMQMPIMDGLSVNFNILTL